MRSRHLAKFPFVLLLGALLVLGAACGDDDDTVVSDNTSANSAASASPTALAGVEEDVEAVEISVENGELSADEVEFQEDSPASIQVTNNDDARYTLTIDTLAGAGVSIVPGETTAVEFTTSTQEGEYEAQLLAEDGGEPLDTMTVVVTTPGNVDNQP